SLERGDRQNFRLAAGQVGEATQHVHRRRPVRAPADFLEEIGVRHKLGLDLLAARFELVRQASAEGVRRGTQPPEGDRVEDRPAERGQDHRGHGDPADGEAAAPHGRFSTSAMLMLSCSAFWSREGRTSHVLSWNRGATAGSWASAAMKFAISTSRELPGTTVVLTSIWNVTSLDCAAACGDCACPGRPGFPSEARSIRSVPGNHLLSAGSISDQRTCRRASVPREPRFVRKVARSLSAAVTSRRSFAMDWTSVAWRRYRGESPPKPTR